METVMFRFNPPDDIELLAHQFQSKGHIQIANFLHLDDASSIYTNLRSRTDWTQILTTASGYVELDRKTRAAIERAKAKALEDAVYAQAREGFQYRFETIRVPDGMTDRQSTDDILVGFADLMSSKVMRDFVRAVSGGVEIEYADAQATAYSPGDFLTGHDDEVEGKSRRAAYVFGLTPIWRLEWGGILLFHGNDGNVERGLVPSFNSLNLFAIPKMHSVSEVTRAAAYRRYSITGWLRAEKQPD